jgi:superfamily II DNA/RNA helicase
VAKLREGVQIVVGTPGRVLNMINLGALKKDTITVLCPDEAYEILSQDQIYDIFRPILKSPSPPL